LITLSPKGKISRYLFGTTFNPFDVKLALIDAQSGKTSPTIAKVLQFCFSYDPEGRGYTLNITRIVGGLMLIGAGIFLAILIIVRKKDKKRKGV
jgi:protein SCO1/2